MALKATIVKAELQISDLDRQYYQSHALTVAQHPSETEERLMIRLIAFALYADPELQFTRGLSSVEEPELWRHGLSGEIELWLELGQPDERRLRKACGRARRVVVLCYGGRGAENWWVKNGDKLAKLGNLAVLNIPPTSPIPLQSLVKRQMQLQFTISDGQIWLTAEGQTLEIKPVRWLG
jgi:uncharacterized protein YaeQ